MTAHRNPDTLQSVTEGVKIEPNGIFVAHAFVAGLTSSVGIGATVATSLALGANQAVVQAQTATVFYRLDGVAPTASVGIQIAAGQSVALNMADAAAALFISATGGIAVTYTM